jgi:PAS domain S-box-containing protein
MLNGDSIAAKGSEHERILRESAARYFAIVDTATDAIVVADRFGQVRSVNRSAETIFGYSAQEMIGESIALLMPQETRASPDNHRTAHRGAGGIPWNSGIGSNVIGRRKDGSEVALELSVAEWRDVDGQHCFTGIMRDVTARNARARELKDAIEIAHQARIEAESASRAKTEFLAVMSHEIRTPLTSISGFVELLSRTRRLTRQQRRYIGLVGVANEALLTIVNDILDFSKIEAGQLELERRSFSPLALIRDMTAIVQVTASSKKLDLKCVIDRNVSERLLGDEGRLRQVLLNLLNNAVKFTAEGSISISVRKVTGADGRERIRFCVADTGIGIPADVQHRLFKRFSQADSSISRRYGGTGLGLAICRRLVELMDGEIGVVSTVGKGTEIWFTANLPASAAASRASEPDRGVIEDFGQGGRILVVDDIDSNREIVEAYLEGYGFHVATVESGALALRALEEERFDLVLMDIQMPDMDGVTATRFIRALPSAIKDVPIIAMTGNVLPEQVRAFLDAGMNDHVGKPIERTKLCSSVKRWLPRGEASEVRVRLNSPQFDRLKYDEFVRLVGSAKAEHIATRFLGDLSAAFRSSAEAARREAHALVNAAGVLGFGFFVDVCRAIEVASPEDVNQQNMAIQEGRRAQSLVRQTLLSVLLPELRGTGLRATG